MGQIIIDLPLRVKRRYKIEDVESANEILAALKIKAQQITENSAKPNAEDSADIRAVNRARKGELISWEEAEIFLDTLD